MAILGHSRTFRDADGTPTTSQYVAVVDWSDDQPRLRFGNYESRRKVARDGSPKVAWLAIPAEFLAALRHASDLANDDN